MATNAHTLSSSFATLPDFLQPSLLPPAPHRRRSNPVQGRALEILGHAIEYLMDSRVLGEQDSYANDDAIRILMVCSRSVFLDCAVVEPWHQRVQQGLLRRLRAESR